MRRATAFTLVETLIVVLIMGTFVLGAVATASPWAFARAYAVRIAAARFEAIASGRHVALGERPCDGAARLSVALGPGSAVILSYPPRGLMFTPDGLPRTCDGGGVGNTTILLEHRGRQAAVIVSSLGRVRWEMR